MTKRTLRVSRDISVTRRRKIPTVINSGGISEKSIIPATSFRSEEFYLSRLDALILPEFNHDLIASVCLTIEGR
jgi:hypothetical protein